MHYFTKQGVVSAEDALAAAAAGQQVLVTGDLSNEGVDDVHEIITKQNLPTAAASLAANRVACVLASDPEGFATAEDVICQ